DPGDKKKNDKVEQSKARTFKEVAIEWHGTNKKWSEDHAHRVLKSLEDNLFAVKGAPAKAETHAYDGKSPYYNDCASSGSTKKSSNLVNASNQVIGVVELKFSSTCKTAWAKIT
ncbi:YjfA family protein, partial [Escherichia coli]|nr:YjfA family protein [Escherichia coli]